MTRREKVQRAILTAITNRPKAQLGSDAPPLELEDYEPATVRAIADEMEREGLIVAEIESNKEGTVEAVIPHGLTRRGEDYLELLNAAP